MVSIPPAAVATCDVLQALMEHKTGVPSMAAAPVVMVLRAGVEVAGAQAPAAPLLLGNPPASLEWGEMAVLMPRTPWAGPMGTRS